MKNGVLISWTAPAICEMFKTSWQMGKLAMKEDSENHSKTNNSIWFDNQISPNFSQRLVKTSPVWQESFTRNISCMRIDRG